MKEWDGKCPNCGYEIALINEIEDLFPLSDSYNISCWRCKNLYTIKHITIIEEKKPAK